MICRREDGRITAKELDPEGVSLRTRKRLHRRKYISKGSNYTWHIDGHDKLKPFGFSMHGSIDRFSKKMIWLKVGSIVKYGLDPPSNPTEALNLNTYLLQKIEELFIVFITTFRQYFFK